MRGQGVRGRGKPQQQKLPGRLAVALFRNGPHAKVARMKSNTNPTNSVASNMLDAWARKHFDAGDVPAWLTEDLRTAAHGNAAFANVEAELVQTLDVLHALRADPETFAACIFP